MAQLKIEVTGVDAALKDINETYQEFLERAAVELKSDLQKYTPIRSGNARRNWQETTSKDGFEVTNSVPYIERLENNWSKQTRGKGITGPALKSFNRKKIV